MSRNVRVIVLALAGTLAVFVLLLAHALTEVAPWWVRKYWLEWRSLAVLVTYAIARGLAACEAYWMKSAGWATIGLQKVDRLSEQVLQRGLKFALGALCLVLLLEWVPQYLTWPSSRDQETFVVLAQSWDRGILPYRDIRAYNFPGAIYIAWVLGKVFGWGHTVTVYAFDAGCLVLLGAVMLKWSRTRLGGAVPGLVGYIAFLSFYLGLQYENVAQRDWQTALLACVAILLLQTSRARSIRLLAALAAALALAIRPHAVLFLPALAWEAAHGAGASETGWSVRIRASTLWCLWCAAFVALAFAPLVTAGIADDLVRGLSVAAYGGPYSRATPGKMIGVFVDQFRLWRVDVPIIATAVLAFRPRYIVSGMARTWLLAVLGALVYRPIHPVHHFYLVIPIVLVSSITWSFVAWWSLSLRRIDRPLLVLAFAFMICEIMPQWPLVCSVTEAWHALPPLSRGEMPDVAPLGCIRAYPRFKSFDTRWEAYRKLLSYLRTETSSQTLVANMLNGFPYEAINGPTGRLSPFCAESGICWMVLVDTDLDPEFAQSLIDATDSVVVWRSSQEHVDRRLRLKQVVAVIRQYYEPAAQFGEYEVWRRKPPDARPGAAL